MWSKNSFRKNISSFSEGVSFSHGICAMACISTATFAKSSQSSKANTSLSVRVVTIGRAVRSE